MRNEAAAVPVAERRNNPLHPEHRHLHQRRRSPGRHLCPLHRSAFHPVRTASSRHRTNSSSIRTSSSSVLEEAAGPSSMANPQPIVHVIEIKSAWNPVTCPHIQAMLNVITLALLSDESKRFFQVQTI